MQPERISKPSFTVIGKMGSTEAGEGFVAALWADANAHFHEIAHLVKQTENGSLAGVWGAMSDFAMNFLPWTADFSEGLYLAGAECRDEADAPEGWTKWVVPGFEYLRLENGGPETFARMISYMKEAGIPLVGAVQELTDPASGKEYLLFPVRRL